MKKRISILLLLIIFLQTISPTIPGLTKIVRADQNYANYEFEDVKDSIITYNGLRFKITEPSTWKTSEDGKVEVCGLDPNNKRNVISIPSFLNEMNYKDSDGSDGFVYDRDYIVEGIADNAFKDCKQITKVNIYSGKDKWDRERMKYIGKNAFKNCINLTEVYIGKCSKWESDCFSHFDDYAFDGCRKLGKITYTGEPLKNMKCLNRGVFKDTDITKYIIYANNTKNDDTYNNGLVDEKETIPQEFFEGCNNLKTVKILGTVKNIGDYAFKNCNNLCKIEDKERLYVQWF